MTLQSKKLGLTAGGVMLVLAAGCSGINTRHSVSPASFFLPGLLQAEPPPATDDVTLPEATTLNQVALAR